MLPSESVINGTASNLATFASYDNNLHKSINVISLKNVDKSTNIPLVKSNDSIKVEPKKQLYIDREKTLVF